MLIARLPPNFHSYKTSTSRKTLTSAMMRSGIKVITDVPGAGDVVQRQHVYQMRLKIWLNRGEPVRWQTPWGFVDRARLEDQGETLVTDLRIDRENLINGLFHGIQGMRIGGTRTLRISPHLAYGDRGVPGIIPSNAVLTVEIGIIEERTFGATDGPDSTKG